MTDANDAASRTAGDIITKFLETSRQNGTFQYADLRHDIAAALRSVAEPASDDMRLLRSKGRELCRMIDGFGSSRELDFAMAKVEEAIMWAAKHLSP